MLIPKKGGFDVSKKHIFVLGLLCILVVMSVGCTATYVRWMEPVTNLQSVCIQKNPEVSVPNFLNVVENGFARHGISTEVYSGKVPDSCEYILTYVAFRTFDVAPFLSHAEISLKRAGKRIAYAEYHLKGKGGFSLVKWKSVKSKMDPVIDELLKEY